MTLCRSLLALIVCILPGLAQANVYCAAGQNESVFPVAASGDDGYAHRIDTAYPPVTGAIQGSANTYDTVERSLHPSGAQYETTIILQRWNTATQPGGSAWPTGTMLVNAFVSERYAGGAENTDGKSIVFEWYSWTPPITDSYWTNDVPSSGASSYAGTTTIGPAPGYGTTELTHLSNVNLSGYTAIRVSVGDAITPTGTNLQGIYAYDYGPGAIPLLALCWTQPTRTGTITSTATKTPAVTSTLGISNTPTVTPTTTDAPLTPVVTGTPTRTPTPTPREVTAIQTPVVEDGRYLPPNTWVRLDTVATQRFIPRDFTDCTQVGTLSRPVGRRASSIIYGGSIFYFGGGNGSYPANDVELFDIASNTWTQQYQPECLPTCCFAGRCVSAADAGRMCSSDADCQGSQCGEGQCYTGPDSGHLCTNDSMCVNRSCSALTCSGGMNAGTVCAHQADCPGADCSPCGDACAPGLFGVGTSELTPLGRPYVEHAYQLTAFNPLRQKYTSALTSGLWEWDPSTKDWDRLTPERPMSNDISTKMLVYDPDLETVLYFATTSFNHTVFRFDYTTNTWLMQSPIPDQISWAQIFSAYDSNEHKYLVSHGSGTMWIYDAQGSTWTQLKDVPADAVFRPGTDTNSIAYDPIAGVFLLAKRGSSTPSVELWSYSIPTDTWTQLEATGGPPAGPTTSYNGLVYDRIWKRFYFLNVRSVGSGGQGGGNEADVETWAYRIGGPVGPGDANCDGRVSAADLSGVIQSLGSDPTHGCGVVDTNRDGVVSEVDLSGTAAALFEVP